jgi:hypothetical protein
LRCHENCETCVEGEKNGNQSCLTCKKNVPYLINANGYNKNCVDNCSKFNLTLENDSCINKSDITANENNQPDYMLLIFFILIAIIFIVIGLTIWKSYSSKNEEDLVDNIKTELKDKIIN